MFFSPVWLQPDPLSLLTEQCFEVDAKLSMQLLWPVCSSLAGDKQNLSGMKLVIADLGQYIPS